MTTIVRTTAQAAAIARVRTSHWDKEIPLSVGQRERGRRMAAAKIAGAATSSTTDTSEGPLSGLARRAPR